MPEENLAQLVDDKKKGLLTGHQEEWFNDFLEPDPNSPLGYKAKDLPSPSDTNELTEEELRKLYTRFAVAISGMKNASIFYDSVKDKAAADFVKLWFDERKLFSNPKATNESEAAIGKLVAKLDETGKTPEQIETIKNIKQVIKNEAKKDNGDNLFDKVEDVDKLLAKCKSKKYNTDTSVQDKIQRVARTLDNYLNAWSWNDENTSNAKQKNKEYIGDLSDDLSVIGRDDAFSNIEIDNDNLRDFRDLYAKELLDTLYQNKSIRDKFGDKDPKFKEIIEKAEKKVSWHDPQSEDFVDAKIEDSLSPMQQIEKWAKDTYSDTLKKYEELRGGHLFFGVHAKEICKAIDKEGVKPADGLKGLLDKADAIKKRISNKRVQQHFDWFVETMNSVKDKIPKAIEGCWNNAEQMKCVIQQIILKATDPRNDDPQAMDKARTAMEIMTTMKYGMLTSKVMNAMKQADFTVFSDKSLSWNKNEGIQFVTKAFDKSVKAAFLGIGYGVTIARNKIMMSGMKFKDKNNLEGPLATRFQQEKDRLNTKHANDINSTNLLNAANTREIGQHNQTLHDLDTVHGINETTINTVHNPRLATLEADMKNAETDKQSNLRGHQAYTAAEKIIQKEKDNRDKLADINTEIKNLKDAITGPKGLDVQIQQKKNELNNPATYKGIPAAVASIVAQKIQQEIDKLEEDKSKIEQDIQNNIQERDNIDTAITDPDYLRHLNNARRAIVNYGAAHTAYKNADSAYQSAKVAHDDLNDKVQQFTDATKKITELNDAIDARNKALTNWPENNVNKVKDLEDYWNFLQTGKTTTWRFSQKSAQKKFDASKQMLLQKYIAQQGLAA